MNIEDSKKVVEKFSKDMGNRNLIINYFNGKEMRSIFYDDTTKQLSEPLPDSGKLFVIPEEDKPLKVIFK